MIVKVKLCALIILSLFFMLSNVNASTQNPIKTISNINKILQGEYGFIWVAGQQGLTRVDGNSNINFSLNNSDWPLAFNWVHDVAKIDNKLLLATEINGLWLFNPDNGQAEKIPVNTPSQSYYGVVAFQGYYYINVSSQLTTKKNLYRFNPRTNTTQLLYNDIKIDDLVHSKDNLFVSSADGLFKLVGEKLIQIIGQPITAVTALNDSVIAITANKLVKLADDSNNHSISHNEKIYGLTKEYSSNNFFTINAQGVVTKYDGASLDTLPNSYDKSETVYITDAYHDASGVLWLSSSKGVERLNENYIKNHEIIFDIKRNANEIALFNDEIIIGSYGAGLQNFLTPLFNAKTNANFSTLGLKIFHLLEVNKELYIATQDGLWIYEEQSNSVNKLAITGDKLILKLKHLDNLLYILTDDYGLYIYDLITKQFVNHISIDNGLLHNEVIDVLPVNNNVLWIANSNAISLYNQITNDITTLQTPNKSKVISLLLADNKIFATTLGDGMMVFNKQGDLLAQIKKGHRFNGMLFTNNEIWVAGKPGLYRVSPQNYEITMVGNTQQYDFVSYLQIKNDTLYASHYGGILALDLQERKTFNPNVVISKTTVSGSSFLLNKKINIASGNDVITLNLASLDFRPGLAKKYQYRINNTAWQQMSNNQLTLTGLASGYYNLEIKATNSLGQWSDNSAYTEIEVAYPWYWTTHFKIFYVTLSFLLISLTAWLLYLRSRSIKKIHHLLQDDMRNYGKLIKVTQRNLQLAENAFDNNDQVQGRSLVSLSLSSLQQNISNQEPDNLSGQKLSIAVPFLADYVLTKFQVKMFINLNESLDELSYALQSDLYKIIYESIMFAILKRNTTSFNLTLKTVKQKLWLTIVSDNDAFNQLDSKVDFDLSSYTIRQIATKNNAYLNIFADESDSSQLVISFPLMPLR